MGATLWLSRAFCGVWALTGLAVLVACVRAAGPDDPVTLLELAGVLLLFTLPVWVVLTVST